MKESLPALCGHMHQVAGIKDYRMESGPAKGMGVFEVTNGSICFTLLKDRCLDVSALSYRGVNFSFLAKPGLLNPGFWGQGSEAIRTIMGGFLFMAGLENIGPPCTVDGRNYPMHGSLRSAPAEQLCCTEGWQQDRYVLRVCGQVRQAQLFGGNLVLRRSWTTALNEKAFMLEDEIENQGFSSEPALLLYHFNLGYPLLSPGARVLLPSCKVVPRDADAEAGLFGWREYGEPIPEKPEEVFEHRLACGKNGDTFAAVYQPALRLGLCIRYNNINLPRFYQWKTEAAGDYALGLEPANAHIGGRAAYEKEGLPPPVLAPGEKLYNRIICEILDGEDSFAALKEECGSLLHNQEGIV